MGQILKRVQELEKEVESSNFHQSHHQQQQQQHQQQQQQHQQQLQQHQNKSTKQQQRERDVVSGNFPDLAELPPEISLLVLSNLNATDLCLAACVWQDLGNDEILWHSLCRNQWQWVSAYDRMEGSGRSYRNLYMRLDEATLTFNADPELGVSYLLKHDLVDDDPRQLALFLHTCKNIDIFKKREFLSKRQDILDEVMKLQNFENQFLPNALRKFFRETATPGVRTEYLSDLVKKFAQRFCSCNPHLKLSQDTIYVVCFSLIMLSVDLASPQIKNKMSKREFIRNVRRAVAGGGVDDEFVGHLYDNVYLVGHVAPKAWS